MQTVIDSMSEGVVAADIDGNFTLFNPSARRIVGIGKTDTRPEQWSERYGIFYLDETTPVPPEELPLGPCHPRRIVGRGGAVFIRNENLPRGAIISVSGRPLRDSEGTLGGGVIVFRDVTEQIQESRFNQMLVNLVKNSIEAIDALGKAGGAGTENAHICIDSYLQGEFLVIDVTDTGIGIEESRRPAGLCCRILHEGKQQRSRPSLCGEFRDQHRRQH